MLTFNDTFKQNSVASSQAPRFVFVISWDTANTDLQYVSSHADAALATAFTTPYTYHAGALISGGAISQTLNPDVASSSIGSMSLTIADVYDSGGVYTFSQRLSQKANLRGKRVQAYMGYQEMAWADYELIQTQIVSGMSNQDGQWTIQCEDVQRQTRKDIFDIGTCKLSSTIDDAVTTIPVNDTAAFSVVEHSEGYSDAPSFSTGTVSVTNGSSTFTLTNAFPESGNAAIGGRIEILGVSYEVIGLSIGINGGISPSYAGATGSGIGFKIWPKVGYIRIEDEVIRWTGKTSTSFTGCKRGALNTLAAAHKVDTAKTTDDRKPVLEYIYLEMPIPKMILALLTGTLYQQNGALLPSAWHAGVDPAYVNTAEFISAGSYDLYYPGIDTRGISALFKGMTKTDAKTFIERELCLLCGAFLPVRATGALGFKRTSSVPSYTPGAFTLNADNVTDYSELTYDMQAVKSSYSIEWAYEDFIGLYLRENVLADTAVVGHENPFELKFKGLASSKHTVNQIRYLTDAYRDRYANPPMRITLGVLPTVVGLEVGDVVQTNIPGVKDPKGWNVPSLGLYSGMEIQSLSWDFISAHISVTLMGRSSETRPITWADYGPVLPDAWYTSQGGASVTGLAGYSAGHLTVNCTMTNGGTDMVVWYHAGDLTVDVGATVTIQKNVALYVRGVLTINGTISGVGQGVAGAVWPGIPTDNQIKYGVVPTQRGYGVVQAGLGFHRGQDDSNFTIVTARSKNGQFSVSGVYGATLYQFNLAYDGTSLTGIPAFLDGQPGSTGSSVYQEINPPALDAAGGAGGAGGTGLITVCRGLAIGVNGKIDLSGGDGVTGGVKTTVLGNTLAAGSGAGGAPGGFLLIVDGSTSAVATLTDTNIVQKYGRSPVQGSVMSFGSSEWPQIELASVPRLIGYGKNTNGGGAIYSNPNVGADAASGTLQSARSSATRVQYLAKQLAAVEDGPVAAPRGPTGLVLASGTATLLKSADGTITPRIKSTWTASTDQNVIGYRVYFHASTEFPRDRRKLAEEPTQDQAEAYIYPVVEGVTYLVTVVAVNRWGFPSGALSSSHLCLGKSVPPGPVTGLTATGGALSIAVTVTAAQMPTDIDLGYIQVFSSLTNDVTASDLFFTQPAVPGKQFGLTYPVSTSAPRYHWVKTSDTSHNQSTQYPVSNTAGVVATPYSAAQFTNDYLETLSLIATGNCVVEGNQVYKNGGSTGWDSSVYSKESYAGGAFVSWVAAQTDKYLSIGLDTNPTQDSDRLNLNYELHLVADGTIRIYENNIDAGGFGAFTVGDVLTVVYDGVNVKYYKNGAVLRTVAAAESMDLFLDSSFYAPSGRVKNLRFGPLSSQNWNNIGGLLRPQDNATATSAQNLVFNGAAEFGDSRNFTSFTYDATDGASGKGCFSYTTSGVNYPGSVAPIPVNTLQQYEISAAWKCSNTTSTHYVAFQCLDANQVSISPQDCYFIANTRVTFYEAAAQGAAIVKVNKPATAWQTSNTFLMLDVAADGSNLPIHDTLQISSIDTSSPSYNVVTLSVGLPYAVTTANYAANSQSGGTFNYILAAAETATTSWQTRSARIEGVNGINTVSSNSQFRRGTAFVALQFIVNANNVASTTWKYDDLAIRALGSLLPTVADGTAVYRTTGAPTNNPVPSASPASPTITYNTNGTANIRVDWNAYTQGAAQADLLLLFWSKGASAPTLNDSSISFNVNTSGPSYYVFEGVNPVDTWSFGIAAARRTEAGLVVGSIIAPTSSPDWIGITGTTPNYTANLNGTAASDVVANAGNGATAYSGTTSYRTAGSPGGTFTFGSITQVAASNGLINVTVNYTYAAGPRVADQFFVFVREGGGTVVASDPAFTTNAVDGSIMFGLKSSTTYTFGLSATRRTENGFESTAIQTSSTVNVGVANFTDNIEGTAASIVLQGANRANTAINSSGNVITKVVPTIAAAPSGAGLYVANDYLGYYNGSSWRAYIDGSGNAYFGDGASNYVKIQGAAGSIRGYSVVASNHLTVGSTLTAAATAGDGTLYLGDTTDFPASGDGYLFGTTNDVDLFAYTGTTSTTLTGCTGVLAQSTGTPCVPAIAGMHVLSGTNRMRFIGNGVFEYGSLPAYRPLISIGSKYSSDWSKNVLIEAGDTSSEHIGAVISARLDVMKLRSYAGVVIEARTETALSCIQAFCEGTDVNQVSVHGDGGAGYGGQFKGGAANLILPATGTAPTNIAGRGSLRFTTGNELYLNQSSGGSGTDWNKVLTNKYMGKGCRAYDGAPQTITTSTATDVQFASEAYDDLGFHHPSTNNDRLTIPAGITRVMVTATVNMNGNATGYRLLRIMKNTGAGSPTTEEPSARADGNATANSLNATGIYDVVEGDYLKLVFLQTSGGNLDIIGRHFSIVVLA